MATACAGVVAGVKKSQENKRKDDWDRDGENLDSESCKKIIA